MRRRQHQKVDFRQYLQNTCKRLNQFHRSCFYPAKPQQYALKFALSDHYYQEHGIVVQGINRQELEPEDMRKEGYVGDRISAQSPR